MSRPFNLFFGGFNRMFDKLGTGICRADPAGAAGVGAHADRLRRAYRAHGFEFSRTPSGFIPPLDRAYFIAAISLPPGASLERTDRVVRRASEILLSRPGVANAVAFAGFDGATFTNAPNSGVVFVTLKPFEERVRAGLATANILNDLRGQMQALREAFVLVIPPPSVPGIGTGGGFKLYVQDRAGRGPRALEQAVGGILGPANQTPGLVQVFTLFNTSDAANLRRYRSHQGRNAGGADHAFLRHAVDLYGLDLRQRLQHPGEDLSGHRAGRQSVSAFGSRCRKPAHPLGHGRHGAARRCRALPEITGPTACRATICFQPPKCRVLPRPGFSTGQAIAAMERILAANLPSGFGFEWTEIALQEKVAGNTA